MKLIKHMSLKVSRLSIAAEDLEVYSAAIKTSAIAAQAIRSLVGDEDCEIFVAIPMDVSGKPLGITTVGIGGVDNCPVDIRKTFRVAIIAGATSIIVGHNHPSGQLIASQADIALTTRLVECGRLLGLPILDHVIVTNDGHVSMREESPHMFTA